MPNINQVRRVLLKAPAVVASALDPATTAWVAAVASAGGTVSAPRQAIVDTFIKALKAASLFATMDRYWLLAGEDAGSAKVDMISLASWTFQGSNSFATGFSANNGYTGNASDNYLDTGFVPNSAGGQYSQNSAHLSAYVLSNRISGAEQNWSAIGTDSGAHNAYSHIIPFLGTTQSEFLMNGCIIGGFPTSTTSRGAWLAAATGASVNAAYKNGASFATDTTTVQALSDTSIVIAATRIFGGVTRYSGDQIAAAGFGGGMTGSQVLAFEAAQNAMMTSIGINVH